MTISDEEVEAAMVAFEGTGGFANQRMLAALTAASQARRAQQAVSVEAEAKRVAFELCTHEKLRITLAQMEFIEEAVLSALRSAQEVK